MEAGYYTYNVRSPHAGLLKAVDGCNPYDGEGLQTLVDELKVTVAE
ncbi:MAG: hypothetical protein IJ716_04820 [Lachnospiraceae bacterium]|nr:hypothetical protein [Lachnospiraceae bacterium]